MRSPLLIAIASIALAATMLGAAGGAGQDAERQLKAAINTELVDGNLRLAIEQYKNVAESGNRALAAQALLRMADCYQKLGDREAQAIYGRLVRDYGDQKDAVAIARARLGPAAAAVRSKSDRPVWSGPDTDGFGTISQDGRYLTYTDWRNGGRLVLRDLETGSDRLLTDSAQGSTQFSVISKNSKDVVYEWFARDGNAPPELRIMSLSPTSSAAPRRLTFVEDVSGIAAFDWSADGEWLAVQLGRKDRTKQIGIVKVQDGSLRVLKSIDWKNTIKIFFSPDSRFLAYDLPVSETTNHRHVFVMAIDGTREMAAVAHASNNVIMGWSPDGRQLLFSSDRGGTTGLWALAIADGKAMGAPSLVRPDVAASWSLGVTAAGSMYVWKDRRGLSVRTAALDLTSGKLLPERDMPEQFIRSRGRPAWSNDGKHLAYQSCNGLGAGPCTVLTWSLETGKVTELPTTIKYQQGFNWSPDGRFLMTPGVDFRGRRGIYRIDAQTGESSPVLMSEAASPQWSADGRSIYYRARDLRGTLVVKQHDLASAAEREVLRTPADTAGFLVSSDERSVAYSAREGHARTVQVIPFNGGPTRVVLESTAPEEVYPVSWTPDNRALLVLKMRDGMPSELWLAPVSGEGPRKIEGDISQWTSDGSIRLSPDGTKVAFVHAAGPPGYEIWAIENFLPGQVTARPSAKR